LRVRGYKVVEASDGLRAIALFQEMGGGVDLLLTDVEMSPMSGYDLARKLLAMNAALKVVYMSGLPADRRHVGANTAFLKKPFRPPDAHLREIWQMLRKPMNEAEYFLSFGRTAFDDLSPKPRGGGISAIRPLPASLATARHRPWCAYVPAQGKRRAASRPRS
jgi:CheY-like chemotaxis protein